MKITLSLVPPLLVASLGLAPFLLACESAQAIEAPVEVPVLSVETAPATLVDSPVRLRLTGNLRGERETDLAANVAGRLTSTEVERGQEVKEGDILATVDTRAAQLALQEARVSVETSRARDEINRSECERYEQMKQAGVVSALEYDQVTAKCKTAPLDLKAAEARQMMAAKNVGDGVIRAPFSGVVTERFVEVGEYVQSSSRVVSLAQVKELKVVFSVPERHFPEVNVGAEVVVRVTAYPKEDFTGRVAHVSGAVRDTRDVVVEATLSNEDSRLLPGMFAEIELVIGSQKLPSIPASSVFERNGKANVYVVVNDCLEERVIAVQSEDDGTIVVQKGVQAGERVVSKITPALKNGTRIQ